MTDEKIYLDADGEKVNTETGRYNDLLALVEYFGFIDIALTLADIATVRAQDETDEDVKRSYEHSAKHCNIAANEPD